MREEAARRCLQRDHPETHGSRPTFHLMSRLLQFFLVQVAETGQSYHAVNARNAERHGLIHSVKRFVLLHNRLRLRRLLLGQLIQRNACIQRILHFALAENGPDASHCSMVNFG